jgi:hypothetical protein
MATTGVRANKSHWILVQYDTLKRDSTKEEGLRLAGPARTCHHAKLRFKEMDPFSVPYFT